jgi:electron transport complex protein RnfC
MTSTDAFRQQPCIHCGDCARVCPESLNPEALFFALVGDDWPTVSDERLETCAECNRCAEACPSRIPLLDWLRWGKSELHERAHADTKRARFLARNARLVRERAAHRARARGTSDFAPPAQTISRDDVLAAIARGRARHRKSR